VEGANVELLAQLGFGLGAQPVNGPLANLVGQRLASQKSV